MMFLNSAPPPNYVFFFYLLLKINTMQFLLFFMIAIICAIICAITTSDASNLRQVTRERALFEMVTFFWDTSRCPEPKTTCNENNICCAIDITTTPQLCLQTDLYNDYFKIIDAFLLYVFKNRHLDENAYKCCQYNINLDLYIDVYPRGDLFNILQMTDLDLNRYWPDKTRVGIYKDDKGREIARVSENGKSRDLFAIHPCVDRFGTTPDLAFRKTTIEKILKKLDENSTTLLDHFENVCMKSFK